MTDRIHSLTVVLEKDMRDDDVECVINAIRMIKCVLAVKGNVSDHILYTAEQRVRSEMIEKLFEVVKR
jgi:hypothetical protein